MLITVLLTNVRIYANPNYVTVYIKTVSRYCVNKRTISPRKIVSFLDYKIATKG